MPPDGLPLQTCLENLEEMVSRAKQNRRKCVVVLHAARQLVQGFQQLVGPNALPTDQGACKSVPNRVLPNSACVAAAAVSAA